MPNCSDCRYAIGFIADKNVAGEEDPTPIIECHRYPPVMQATEDELVMLWPQVAVNDWCGEFTRELVWGEPPPNDPVIH